MQGRACRNRAKKETVWRIRARVSERDLFGAYVARSRRHNQKTVRYPGSSKAEVK